MSHYSGASYHHMPMGGMPMGGVPLAGVPMGAIPVGGMPMGSAYGTPYPSGNSLMMSGLGSEYGGPLTEPMITPIYDDRRSMYDDGRRSVYDYDDRGYNSDYYGRSRSGSQYYDEDPYRRSSSRASRRSSRRDYDDYYSNDRSYDDRYYDDRSSRDYDRHYDSYDRGYGSGYGSSRRYSSSYYPSSSSSSYYPSSRSQSSRRRENISVVSQRDGGIKVLRDGQERISDRVRRMFGADPKGFNIVRLKKGESIATGIRR